MNKHKRISVAPMMDWTTRHCRYFMRLFSPHIILYTEMITSGAILHGDTERFLQFNNEEHPVVIQLGGSDPSDLAKSAEICQTYNYDEINLNIGCPSERVQKGSFGACLMKEADLVADCVRAMRAVVDIPVTVKTRIGVDDYDSYDFLADFIRTVSDAGCELFTLHARKAWLKGLSPKQNREIPPLNYDVVHRIKTDFPDLKIILNGGVKTVAQVTEQLTEVDGVMIGREAFHNPYLLAEINHHIWGEDLPSHHQLATRYLPYVDSQLKQGVYLSHLIRPILGLFNGINGARAWRRHLSTEGYKKDAGVDTIVDALKLVTVG